MDLRYILPSPRAPITLDLFEAESYEPAVVVQQLVGNLVYFSNKGRYEPRLAKSWRRVEPTVWEFELHEGLVCENGEKIDAEGFKRSLKRIIKKMAKGGTVPVLNKLVGFEDYINGDGELSGIESSGLTLRFKFVEPTRSGVVQILSFAPFGYICEDNLNPDGSWKDNKRFISSGPYRVESIEIGSRYVLVRRDDWKLPFSESAPSKVIITHDVPTEFGSDAVWIVDPRWVSVSLPEEFERYDLVPEYLNSILLGNLQSGFFSRIENRRYFKGLVEKHRDLLVPEKWGNSVRSSSMYPTQAVNPPIPVPTVTPVTPPSEPLIIEGKEPKSEQGRYTWKVLKAALDEANIKYQFAGNEFNTAEKINQNYDIRIRGPSIGGGVEAWGLRILFCSKLGVAMPDPTGNICRLLDAYERDEINDEQLTKKFLEQVELDAAIITIAHFGHSFYLSPSIKKESLSPALSIVRFDQLEVE